MNVDLNGLVSLRDVKKKRERKIYINGSACKTIETHLIICIVAVYGLSTLIDSINVCKASFSGVPVDGSSKLWSGSSLIDGTPE